MGAANNHVKLRLEPATAASPLLPEVALPNDCEAGIPSDERHLRQRMRSSKHELEPRPPLRFKVALAPAMLQARGASRRRPRRAQRKPCERRCHGEAEQDDPYDGNAALGLLLRPRVAGDAVPCADLAGGQLRV